jgi:SAM-dependent methyltransferase
LSRSLPLAQLDVKALPFRDASFDCAIALGAVLSHVGESAEDAAREMARVTRPGGLIIVSVLSQENYYLPYVIEQARAYGIEAVSEAIVHGKPLPHESAIPWRGFTRVELETLAAAAGCIAVSMSASNVLATIEQLQLLEELEKDAELWQAFLRWEAELGKRPGNIERGAFIIAVLRKAP